MPIDFILFSYFVAKFGTRSQCIFFAEDCEKKLIGPVPIVNPSSRLIVHFKDWKGGGGSVFFLRCERQKWACKQILLFFWLFARAKSCCTPTFFSTFSAFFTPIFFARPLFLFFAQVPNTVSRAQFWEFAREKLGFAVYFHGYSLWLFSMSFFELFWLRN